MGYYIDEHSINLNALRKRLQTTDLIPSHKPLLDEITAKMNALTKAGINSVADLRAALKTTKLLKSLSIKSGVDTDYLLLLRRVVNGFFPKPRLLVDIDWLDRKSAISLNKIGVKNTQQLYDAVSAGATDVTKETGIRLNDLAKFMEISDLCRIQWVSPTFARVIVEAGITNAGMVAKADPEILFDAITKANEGAKFYKGKVGLRDVKRLVVAAGYVP